MELKLLAAIHISFTRSNLDSDEIKSERLGIETGYKKNLTKETVLAHFKNVIIFPLIWLSSRHTCLIE